MKISNLEQRYNVARSAIYTRMKKAGIVPERSGRNAYLNDEQLRQMDELDKHLKSGGEIATFAGVTVKPVGATASPSPIASFQALEEACRNAWELATSQICALLNVPQEKIEAHSEFADAGFTFQRVGDRLNGEAAWRVLKH